MRSPFHNAEKSRAQGFTLLEVMLAVAILAIITMSIYRFLETNLTAISFGTKYSDENAQLQSLVSVIRLQLSRLPKDQPGAMLGESHKFNNAPSDELNWVCGAGSGLFTRHAAGLFRVRLMLRPVSKTSNEVELGIRRQPVQEGVSAKENWLPLMTDVKALEFRYFDPRLNSWVEKWTDQNARPALVRMRLWRDADSDPHEEVFALPKLSMGNAPKQ